MTLLQFFFNLPNYNRNHLLALFQDYIRSKYHSPAGDGAVLTHSDNKFLTAVNRNLINVVLSTSIRTGLLFDF